MQDRYVGDIGDYCKFSLLRAITRSGLSLGINWYKTDPESNNDGNHTEYLYDFQSKDFNPYREYDRRLYDKLKKLVDDKFRNIEAIKDFRVVKARFYAEPVPKNENRKAWHEKAKKKLCRKDIVFLDPDNGIETPAMMSKKPGPKYVGWAEITDYYRQKQSIIIYQHFQRKNDNNFIEGILNLQSEFVNSYSTRIVKYSSWGIRYYIFLLHKKHCRSVKTALSSITDKLPSDKFVQILR